MEKEDETFALRPWGCLYVVLKDYGVDISGVTPRMGEHMVNDFMELMVTNGYLAIAEEVKQ